MKYPEEVNRVFLEYLMDGRRGLMLPWLIIPAVVWLMWEHVPHVLLLWWGCLAYMMNGFRLFSYPLRREQFNSKEVESYLLRFSWSTNLYGLVWGVGGVLLMPYLPFEYQLFFMFTIAGTAMAMVFLVVSRETMLVFPCMVLPVAAWLFLQDNEKHIQMGLLAMCFLIFVLMAAKRHFQRFSDSVSIRYENDQLIDELKHEIVEHQRTALELEAAKQKAEAADEAKSEFLSVMSHELRTPIHGIMGTLDMLESAPLSQEHREHLSMAKQASASLRLIVNDVLDLAKLTAGKVELQQKLLNLREFMDGVVQSVSMLAKQKGLVLQYVLDDVPGHVVCDDVHLRQALVNILGNAVKFTEQGSVRVYLMRQGDDLLVKVVDTGIGIAEEDIDSIFDPFHQVKQHMESGREGTGLGTAIAKRFIELMCGDIRVESRLGEGSSFFIRVPCGWQGERVSMTRDALDVLPSASPFKEHMREKQQSVMPPKRILIAEDDDISRKIIRRSLERKHCAVDVVDDGLKAWEKAQVQTYDLILLDVRMPGMDGMRVTQCIREMEQKKGGHVCIIGLSAHASDEIQQACLDVGMDYFFMKPMSMDDLVQCMKACRT